MFHVEHREKIMEKNDIDNQRLVMLEKLIIEQETLNGTLKDWMKETNESMDRVRETTNKLASLNEKIFYHSKYFQ